MDELEDTIVSMAKQMILEMRHSIAMPRNTDEEQTLEKKYNITSNDLCNNEIANKMVEIKTPTHISFIK